MTKQFLLALSCFLMSLTAFGAGLDGKWTSHCYALAGESFKFTYEFKGATYKMSGKAFEEQDCTGDSEPADPDSGTFVLGTQPAPEAQNVTIDLKSSSGEMQFSVLRLSGSTLTMAIPVLRAEDRAATPDPNFVFDRK
jgi:hypothetical protein